MNINTVSDWKSPEGNSTNKLVRQDVPGYLLGMSSYEECDSSELRNYPDFEELIGALGGFEWVNASQSIRRIYLKWLNGESLSWTLSEGATLELLPFPVCLEKGVNLFFRKDLSAGVLCFGLARGYPPVTIVDCVQRRFINLRPELYKPDERIFSRLSSLLTWLAEHKEGCRLPEPHAMVGFNRSWAHHLWNEIPAAAFLSQELQEGRVRPFTLAIVREPLRMLSRITPMDGIEIKEMGGENEIFSEPFEFRVNAAFIGAGYVPIEIAKKVIEELRSHPLVRQFRSGFAEAHYPLFWISLRAGSRTLSNQDRVLAKLVAELLERYPHSGVVLDGFNYPDDADFGARYPKEFFQEGVDSTAALGDEVTRSLVRISERFAGRLAYTNGLSISDTLGFALHCHFYVTHHGTIQHKIGWLSEATGVVHTNLEIVKKKPAEWAASMCATAKSPIYIPEEMIVEGEGNEDPDPLGRKYQNYGVKEPEFLEFCLNAARTTVPEPPKASFFARVRRFVSKRFSPVEKIE